MESECRKGEERVGWDDHGRILGFDMAFTIFSWVFGIYFGSKPQISVVQQCYLGLKLASKCHLKGCLRSDMTRPV